MAKSKFRRLRDRVVVKRIDAEEKTKAGMVGHRVLFGKWSGTEIRLDGEELLIVKESDILGVLA